MTRTYKLISGDSHVNEPPNLWIDRVPAKFRDRAPRMEHFEQGDAWIIEGALDPISFGLNCNVGEDPAKRTGWVRWEDVRPGGYDPSARVGEQDQDGVDAEILYPSPRIGNQQFFNTNDPEFHLASIQAYNDWLSEYSSYDPERFWGVAMLPNVGVDVAVKELHRAMELPGLRSVMIGQYPHGGTDIEDEDDRLWAELEEMGVPLNVHVGFATAPAADNSTNGPVKGRRPSGALRFYDAPTRAVQFIETGVFDRFPKLQLVFVETDSSWIPYVVEQLDDRYKRMVPPRLPDIKRRAHDYFGENIFTTFITDSYGVENRKRIGVTQMLWSSDYPHTGADWPNSWKTIESHFAGVPEDEKHLILAGNALRMYPPR